MSSSNSSNCPFMKYCPIANQGMLPQGFPFMIQKQKPKVSMGDIIFYIFLGLWVLFIIFAFLESNSFFDELFQFPPNVIKQQQPVQLKIYVSEPFPFQITKNETEKSNKNDDDTAGDSESEDERDDTAGDTAGDSESEDESEDERDNTAGEDSKEIKAAEKKD